MSPLLVVYTEPFVLPSIHVLALNQFRVRTNYQKGLMASTPALIGPKSCEGASPDRCLALPTRTAGDTPSFDFILSLKSILRLHEINEYPFSIDYS